MRDWRKAKVSLSLYKYPTKHPQNRYDSEGILCFSLFTSSQFCQSFL